MSKKVIITVGLPGSGKSTFAKSLEASGGWKVMNCDKMGMNYKSLLPMFVSQISKRDQNVILDNTFIGRDQRKPFIDAAKAAGANVDAFFFDTPKERCVTNVALRMHSILGRMEFSLAKLHNSRDRQIFPPGIIYKGFEGLTPPEKEEGFDDVNIIKDMSPVKSPEGYAGKAVFLDYDNTLRETISGAKYPVSPDDIHILPNRTDTLKRYVEQGYTLLGVSSQPGVYNEEMTVETAMNCFRKTNELLGMKIHFKFCPHKTDALCYCQKPQAGLGIEFMHLYKLDLSQCIVVGNPATDKTFAERLGMSYFEPKDFFIN